MKYFSKVFFLTAIFVFSQFAVLAQETGGVKGKVRDSRSAALSGVSVTAQKNGSDVKTVSTDKNGAFEMNGLAVGTYNFVFSKNGYNSGIRYNVEVRKNKTTDLGNRLILGVDQGTLVIIRGVVFDQNGRAVRGANVEIEKKQADGSYKKVGATTTSYGVEPLATGEFVFRFPQGAANFRIKALLKGISASEEIEVSNAAVYRMALTLKLEN
jgi:hypothetical protein